MLLHPPARTAGGYRYYPNDVADRIEFILAAQSAVRVPVRRRRQLFIIACTVQRMLKLETQLDAMGRLGRAMSDLTRCRMLLRLVDGPAYPAGLADELGLTRSNVSNHLACLRGCGLVVARPEGRQVQYELADGALARGLRELLTISLAVDECPICQGTCTHEPDR